MKFIFGKDGQSVVNVEQIQAAYIYKDEDIDENFNIIPTGTVAVKVILCGQEDRISLAKFDGGDASENLTAAQKYLAELVAKLNDSAAI